jgi:phage terminase large subunit
MESFNHLAPDYLAIIDERVKRLARIEADKLDLQAARLAYAQDPALFIEDWGITHDPRVAEMPYLPFILWDKQREYIAWLHERVTAREDGLVEKSRDAGVTWLNCAFAVWMWLYMPGCKVSFGSRKEALVDKIGDPDAIFSKIRTFLGGIPAVLLPAGFSMDRDASFMKIVNPETGATITGEAGDNIGRGGRSTVYFKDESAFYERPDLIEAALSQNSDCKIDVSTPNGTGNPFWRKRFGGKIAVFVFDWRDDPRKDQAWYERQKDALEPWILAQEVDRDYNASVENITIPAAWIAAAVGLSLPAAGPRIAGLDVADEGGDMNTLVTRRGPVVESVEAWGCGTTTQTARKALSQCRERLVEMLFYDSIGVGAGVKGELAEQAGGDGNGISAYAASLHVRGVSTASRELPGVWDEHKANADMFLNLRAWMWWSLRRRFERTWQHVNKERQWPAEELISLPHDPELVTELSQPLYGFDNAGRIKIEAKKDMAKRGIKSPNKADALALAYSPPWMMGDAFGLRGGVGARRMEAAA